MASPQPAPPAPVFEITPKTVELSPGDVQLFTVTPAGSTVEWKVEPPVGSIDKFGVYSVPKRVLNNRNVVIVAFDGPGFAAATVVLNNDPRIVRALGIYGAFIAFLVAIGLLLFWTQLAAHQATSLVFINPPVVTLDPAKAENFTFTATVLGDAKSTVTWSASAAHSGIGLSIDPNSGLYKHTGDATAKEETITIRAVSSADPSRSDTAIVRLVPSQHHEVVPPSAAVFSGKQVQFRLGDNTPVNWAVSKGDLGVLSSADGTFTAGAGIRSPQLLQVSAWSAPPSRILAAATVAVNPTTTDPEIANWRLLAFVMVMGALGSMLYFSSSFVAYVGNRTFRATWFWFYVSRPFVGAGLAVIFFFLIGAGLVSGATTSDLAKVAAVSALVGLFSDKAVKKLSDIVDAILSTSDDRKDKVITHQTAAPAITAATPPTVTKGAAATVKFTGTNLAKVKVQVNSHDAVPKDVTATGFALDLKPEDTADSKVKIEASNADGSASFEVKTV